MIKKLCVKTYKYILSQVEDFKIRNKDFLSEVDINNYWSTMTLINRNAEISEKKEIINNANKILDGNINILEYPELILTSKIEWNKDYLSGFIWQNKYYKRIKLIDLSNKADIKIPWEISRFHYANTLGMAYFLTKNDIYTEKFINLITHWIENNKYCYSVNWTCAMEVSIRACNWIVAYDFLKESKLINKEFNNLFNKALYLHGKFIMENLENKSNNRNNHYISNLIGLLWIGAYFKEKNFGEKWIKGALDNLLSELKIQVNSDGTSYEASTSYHCLVFEMLLYTLIMFDKNNIEYYEELRVIVEKMSKFLYYIIKPNGRIPLIGDDDSGKFLVFSEKNISKSYYNDLLNLSGVYFNNEEYIAKSRRDKSITKWLFSNEKIKNELHLNNIKKSIAFNDGGFYIYTNKNFYLVVRCGDIGTGGKGAHAHNDQLSFELNVNGNDIFIDSGNYTYTGDYKLRNLFRSTSFHNTVRIENFEQNFFDKRHLFKLSNDTKAELLKFTDNKFIGKHYGYLKKCNTIHKREIDIDSDNIIIKDNLSKKNNEILKLNIYRYLILAPEVDIEIIKSSIIIKSKSNKDKIVEIFIDKNTILEIDDIEVALGYGNKVSTKRISFINTNINKVILKINMLHK